MVWVHFCELMSDVVADSCVEFVYKWVRGRRLAESVTFYEELFGHFSEVGRHVRLRCNLGRCGVL